MTSIIIQLLVISNSCLGSVLLSYERPSGLSKNIKALTRTVYLLIYLHYFNLFVAFNFLWKTIVLDVYVTWLFTHHFSTAERGHNPIEANLDQSTFIQDYMVWKSDWFSYSPLYTTFQSLWSPPYLYSISSQLSYLFLTFYTPFTHLFLALLLIFTHIHSLSTTSSSLTI